MVSTASLNPEDFRHQAAEPALGIIQISQVDRGLQVRSITELHVPCVCGRPLCGIEHEWIHDIKGSALYVTGVCLVCGNQTALYLSEPVMAADDHHFRLLTRLQNDVAQVLRQISELPAAVSEGEAA